MDTDQAISVVMAAHNEENHISEAIESILAQTYDHFELLIVDDGSTDSTRSIVKSFNDQRITLIENKTNLGLPASLNKGINRSKGKYIARMDADDRSLRERFEKQVSVLNNNPKIHVVGCWVRLIDVNGSPLGVKKYNGIGKNPERIKESGPNIAHPSVMMRKTTLEEVGEYREKFTYAQDLDLWVRMAQKASGNFSHIIPDVLFERRLTPAMYRKQPFQAKFAEYAGINDTSQIPQDDLEEIQPLSNSMQNFFYNYRVGRLLLHHGHRQRSIKHYIKSLQYRPYSPRPWYGLLLSVVPTAIRDGIEDTLSNNMR